MRPLGEGQERVFSAMAAHAEMLEARARWRNARWRSNSPAEKNALAVARNALRAERLWTASTRCPTSPVAGKSLGLGLVLGCLPGLRPGFRDAWTGVASGSRTSRAPRLDHCPSASSPNWRAHGGATQVLRGAPKCNRDTEFSRIRWFRHGGPARKFMPSRRRCRVKKPQQALARSAQETCASAEYEVRSRQREREANAIRAVYRRRVDTRPTSDWEAVCRARRGPFAGRNRRSSKSRPLPRRVRDAAFASGSTRWTRARGRGASIVKGLMLEHSLAADVQPRRPPRSSTSCRIGSPLFLLVDVADLPTRKSLDRRRMRGKSPSRTSPTRTATLRGGADAARIVRSSRRARRRARCGALDEALRLEEEEAEGGMKPMAEVLKRRVRRR